MRRTNTTHYFTVISISLSLSIALVCVRAKIIGYYLKSLLLSAKFLEAALISYYDILFVSGITIGCIALIRLFPAKGRLLVRMYAGIAVLTLIAALANIEMVKMLGAPFNYQWFYYSDFLNSRDSINAFLSGLSLALIGKVAVICLAMLLTSWGILFVFQRFSTKMQGYLVVTIVTALVVYVPVARWYITKHQFSYAKLANPITQFAISVTETYAASPALFTRTVPAHRNDFAGVVIPEGNIIRSNQVSAKAEHPVRNVLFFVLESVPAEYITDAKVMPELHRYLPEAMRFSNIYAHSPSTHNSMVAMLTSAYPWISFKSISAEYPAIQLPTLSAELKENGYRTAFIHSSDNRFQRMDEFLANRKFDKIEDLNSIRCDKKTYQSKEEYGPYLDGVDDECLIGELSDWVSADTSRPFFAMLWTMQTHFPYFLSQPEVNYGVQDPYQNRYLNALRHTDQVLGELLATLKKKGLYESTLVVIVGDHGEAFGTHDQYGHGRALYEENVHVPLLLINPVLFGGGKQQPVIGGHIDVAPTVMDILNLPAPAEWQGKSLFNRERPERVYFFAPWTDYKFGYRDGKYKVIYNATKNSTEVFDLLADPSESTNIADQMPEFVEISYDRLAGWIQYHERYFQAALKR